VINAISNIGGLSTSTRFVQNTNWSQVYCLC